jgi:hypothetical protein
MKRALRTLRLLAGTLLIVMGVLVISPAAHAAPMASAARSVSVTFRNQTAHPLEMTYSQVLSGIWTLQPKMYVSPGEEIYFGTASNGFMTGTSGTVRYDFTDICCYATYVTMTWNDPYVGSNSYKVGGLLHGWFHVVQSGGSGNNAQVTFTLLPN